MRDKAEIEKMIAFFDSEAYREDIDESWYADAFAGLLLWTIDEKSELPWEAFDEEDKEKFEVFCSNID